MKSTSPESSFAQLLEWLLTDPVTPISTRPARKSAQISPSDRVLWLWQLASPMQRLDSALIEIPCKLRKTRRRGFILAATQNLFSE